MYKKVAITNEKKSKNITGIINRQKKITNPLKLSINSSTQAKSSMNYWGAGRFSDEIIVNFDI